MNRPAVWMLGLSTKSTRLSMSLWKQARPPSFISSELTEILGMCDRIYVMNQGRIIGEFLASEATQEIVMNCIMQDSKGEIGA